MRTALVSHSSSLWHDPGLGHPERIDRLRSVLRALESLPGLVRLEAPAATRDQLLRVHTPALIDQIKGLGAGMVDADTLLCADSYTAALHAAGAVCAAVDAVMGGVVDNAFCAVRPPGHHAEPDRAMGFCLFNNVAVGAMQARALHGCRRVAVLDFDVHHGNGTQAVAWEDPDFFFASSHQWPFYPGSGARSERGAHGNIVNVPLPEGAGSDLFQAAWQDVILPACRAFGPEIILISAGFDAHLADPLGGLGLETADFGRVTADIMKVARDCCGGRVVSTLEGGYNLAALADSVAAHVRALNEPA